MDNSKRLLEFRNLCQGDTVFCMGSGPSLKRQIDLEFIRGFPIIACNHAYKIASTYSSKTFNVISDYERLKELRPLFSSSSTPLFVIPNYSQDEEYESRKDYSLYSKPAIRIESIRQGDLADSTYQGPERLLGFSHNLLEGIYTGPSVIFSAIQLAAWMGASKIVLLGVDMDYRKDGQQFFEKGIQRPSTPPIDDYLWSKSFFELFHQELNKREIGFYNAASGGKVDCIPRSTLKELLCPSS